DIYLYINPEFFDYDYFPALSPYHCNATCKEKMKVYFKVLLELHYKWTMQYIEDARVVEDLKSEEKKSIHYPNLLAYYSFFENRPLDEIAEERMLRFSKVGLLDGKPVRLCDLQGDTKCDFDATNLEE
ncbi:hypothetical protein DICPUDRAFT_23841, partial [Dictyostelium purpureum]